MTTAAAAPQLENIPQWGKNILRGWEGGQTSVSGEGKIILNLNKINNNSENFSWQDCCQGFFAPLALLGCGPEQLFNLCEFDFSSYL